MTPRKTTFKKSSKTATSRPCTQRYGRKQLRSMNTKRATAKHLKEIIFHKNNTNRMMVLNSPVRGPRSSGRLGRSAAWRRRRRRRARGAGGSGPRRAPRPPPRGLGRASTSCTWRPSSGSRTTASSSGRRTRASSARRHHGVPSGRRSHVRRFHSASSSEVDAGRRFFQADPYGFEVVNYALLALKSEQDSSLLSANFVFAQHQREAFSQQCKASLGNNAVMKALA